MLNCLLVLNYTVLPIRIKILSLKIYFELHASIFVIRDDEKKICYPFLRMGNCLKATEPLRGDHLLLALSSQYFLVLIWPVLAGR